MHSNNNKSPDKIKPLDRYTVYAIYYMYSPCLRETKLSYYA